MKKVFTLGTFYKRIIDFYCRWFVWGEKKWHLDAFVFKSILIVTIKPFKWFSLFEDYWLHHPDICRNHSKWCHLQSWKIQSYIQKEKISRKFMLKKQVLIWILVNTIYLIEGKTGGNWLIFKIGDLTFPRPKVFPD